MSVTQLVHTRIMQTFNAVKTLWRSTALTTCYIVSYAYSFICIYIRVNWQAVNQIIYDLVSMYLPHCWFIFYFYVMWYFAFFFFFLHSECVVVIKPIVLFFFSPFIFFRKTMVSLLSSSWSVWCVALRPEWGTQRLKQTIHHSTRH